MFYVSILVAVRDVRAYYCSIFQEQKEEDVFVFVTIFVHP
jgi:hypothetical protein